MSDRVARRRARTRERIFTEAMRLFSERGFDSVTVAQIAEAADIGKGTFFTHFPSKRDVFRYLGEQVSQVMAEAAQHEGTTHQRLSSLLGAACAWLEDHPEPARQMARSRSLTPTLDLDSPSQQRFHRLLTQILSDGVTAGDLRPDLPVEAAAQMIKTGYYMCVLTWAATPEEGADDVPALASAAPQGLPPRAAPRRSAPPAADSAADASASVTAGASAGATAGGASGQAGLSARMEAMLDLLLRGMQ